MVFACYRVACRLPAQIFRHGWQADAHVDSCLFRVAVLVGNNQVLPGRERRMCVAHSIEIIRLTQTVLGHDRRTEVQRDCVVCAAGRQLSSSNVEGQLLTSGVRPEVRV